MPKIPLAPKVKPSTSTIQKPPSITPTITASVERPVLRAFESMIHVEQAISHLSQIGIFVGEHSEDMRGYRRAAEASLTELLAMYRAYWKKVIIETEGE